MQNRALEKSVWAVSFIFCAGLLFGEPARASAVNDLMAQSQDPRLYIFGLILTFIGAKVFGRSGAQF